ncbi:MAG: DUF4214 domain-containing protein, partial [Desulfobacterales bacterium]
PAGAAFWRTEISRIAALGIDVKEGFRALGKFFFNSAEYLSQAQPDSAYVTDLYATFLGRAPEPAGAAFWTDLLSQGLGRNLLLNFFVFSEEFELVMQTDLQSTGARAENNLVNDLYRGFLNRLPEDTGFHAWRDLMRTAQCTAAQTVRENALQQAQAFVQSAEYAARNRDNSEFVEDLYNGILRRGAQPDEVDFWVSLLDNGALARDDLIREFANSEEFQLRVQAVIDAGCVQ